MSRALTVAQRRVLARARDAFDLHEREGLGTGWILVYGAERVTARWLDRRKLLDVRGTTWGDLECQITTAGKVAAERLS